MSAEKIIEKIQKDSEKEIQRILKEAEQQANDILLSEKQEADDQAKHVLSVGKTQSENIKKILISKASQDGKRSLLKAKEDIIEECFTQATQQLAEIKGEEYKTIVTQFLKDGKKKLGDNCTILVSRDSDKEFANAEGVPVKGTIDSSGGIVLLSADGKISIDYTFKGILKRKKDEIRIQLGKLLFS